MLSCVRMRAERGLGSNPHGWAGVGRWLLMYVAGKFGFLMGLHKETGFEPDLLFLTGLSMSLRRDSQGTNEGASRMIDLLGSLKGNGNGKETLGKIKEEIRQRGLR